MAIVTAFLAILGGLLLTIGRPHRWVGHHLVTIVHEGGHAVAALLTSHGRVGRIELHTHASARRLGYSGITHTRTTFRGQVPMLAGGYPAPAVLGLAALALLHTGHGKGALAALVGALAAMLLLIRNLFGAFLLLVAGTALYLPFLYGSAGVQAAVVGVLAWTLLFGAVHDAVDAWRVGGRGGDAADLAALTGASPALWATLFVLLTAAATGFAGWLTVTAWT